MLWSNANGGVMCPVSMTYAVVPALRHSAPEIAAEWEPRLTMPDYKDGALAGMAAVDHLMRGDEAEQARIGGAIATPAKEAGKKAQAPPTGRSRGWP